MFCEEIDSWTGLPEDVVSRHRNASERKLGYDWYIEGCLENIRPFWISREQVAWPWCDLAGSQRKPNCVSV